MLEKINERVSVVTVYSRKTGQTVPVRLRWQGRDYRIRKVGYHHQALEARLERYLARSTPIELPEAVTEMLQERRAKDAGVASWTERRFGRLARAELYQRPEDEER